MSGGVPKLTKKEIELLTKQALESPRRRHAKILHQPGSFNNQVFNCICQDSYMQPHLHPGSEKIEEINLISGSLSVIFFDDQGTLLNVKKLTENGDIYIKIPAFTWHTYVVNSAICVTFETMEGVYDPKTWKKMAPWAPKETSSKKSKYLEKIKTLIEA